MNWYKYTLFFLLLLILSACSTDIELEAEWKDIPVVYGFLSKNDTAHYIRVEKAFLEPGGDALKIAQNPDSLYYGESVQVRLERLSKGEIFDLERVDGNLEGYPREEGVFANRPNYLYKIKANLIKLQERERIRLIIDRGEGTELTEAETAVLEDMSLSDSSPPINVNWAYDRQVTFRWRTGANTRLFDLRLVINIEEREPDGASSERSLTWVLTDQLENTEGSSQMSFSVIGEDFYKFLAGELEDADAKTRFFKNMEVQVVGGGVELLEFQRVNLANTGITSSQTPPVYTNLSEGRGIFSSRTQATRKGLNISSLSRDSLRNGIHTKHLNFQ